MGKNKIQKSLKIFSDRVKARFQPKQVILFGSYARGEADEYSDVDIIVVAEKFNKTPMGERLDVLYPLTSDLYPDFHVFGLTSKEFSKLSDFVSISEAKRDGMLIR